jgi:hypothetical protein
MLNFLKTFQTNNNNHNNNKKLPCNGDLLTFLYKDVAVLQTTHAQTSVAATLMLAPEVVLEFSALPLQKDSNSPSEFHFFFPIYLYLLRHKRLKNTYMYMFPFRGMGVICYLD